MAGSFNGNRKGAVYWEANLDDCAYVFHLGGKPIIADHAQFLGRPTPCALVCSNRIESAHEWITRTNVTPMLNRLGRLGESLGTASAATFVPGKVQGGPHRHKGNHQADKSH